MDDVTKAKIAIAKVGNYKKTWPVEFGTLARPGTGEYKKNELRAAESG